MGERLGAYPPGRHLLQVVITDRGGGAKSLIGFARIELAPLGRRVAPHPGIAVCLQLEKHRANRKKSERGQA